MRRQEFLPPTLELALLKCQRLMAEVSVLEVAYERAMEALGRCLEQIKALEAENAAMREAATKPE